MPSDTPHITHLPHGLWANVGLCPCIGGPGWCASVASVGEAERWAKEQA